MYKNWPAICQIPDRALRYALSLLDLESEFGQKVASALPQYFSPESQNGPYPLSVLMEDSLLWGLDNEPNEPPENHRHNLWYTETLERFSIPYEWFDKVPEHLREGGCSRELTQELRRKIEKAGGWGGVVTHEGQELFVVCVAEFGQDAIYTVALAPAECIMIDIDMTAERRRWRRADRVYEQQLKKDRRG